MVFGSVCSCMPVLPVYDTFIAVLTRIEVSSLCKSDIVWLDKCQANPTLSVLQVKVASMCNKCNAWTAW